MTQPERRDFVRLRQQLESVLDTRAVIDDPAILAAHLQEPRGRYRGHTPFMICPNSTQQVAETVKLAAAAGIAIVPQGGNTGLVGGATPFESDNAVLLSLSRLNRIRSLDAADDSITVEAGAILQDVQEAAAAADRLFPLSLGAEGTCQIGGNISTNAGGIHVLRYGNMRELVLGLEVVLPEGRIWDGLRRLRKDNTGYDLKQLFIGAEGTLGIVTAAVLKLFPLPREKASALAAVADPRAALDVMSRVRAESGGRLHAAELIPRRAVEFVARHFPNFKDPMTARHDWYLLLEATSGREGPDLRTSLEACLADALESGLVLDAAIAQNEGQAAAFWRLREQLVEVQKREGASIKHDVAVPVSAVPDFLAAAIQAIEELVPGARPLPFGHVGDGNIHFNVSQPEGIDADAFLAHRDEMNARVHDIAHSFGGSISAEHGIGRAKIAENARFKSEIELDLMRRIKRAFDPRNLMNPGKVIGLS